MQGPEFDRFAGSYEDLLKDPIRSRFAGGAGFFHLRKRDLIRAYFERQGRLSAPIAYLDFGCGKGELAALLKGDFARVAGCDPSPAMLAEVEEVETRLQENMSVIPFGDAEFDFVTAVCVYHHVTPSARPALTTEVRRVLKPGGVFAVIEHNPFNPATRLIVSRTPVDADAILLRPLETRRLMRDAGFAVDEQKYFLYLPERIYRKIGALERVLSRIPLGGQYAVFGVLSSDRSTGQRRP